MIMTRYCTNCGSELNEDNTCPTCGAVFDEEDTVTVPEPEAAGDGYEDYSVFRRPEKSALEEEAADEPVAAPEPAAAAAHTGARSSGLSKDIDAAALFGEWLENVRGFFSSRPLDAADIAVKDGSPLWLVYTVVNVVAGALCTAAMTGNGLNWLLGRVFGSFAATEGFVEEYSFGGLTAIFLFSLVTLSGLTAAASGILYGFLKLENQPHSYLDAVRVVSFAFFPLTLTCVAAFVFSFFLYPMAAVLLLTGILTTTALQNDILRRQDCEMNFWVKGLCAAAQLVAGIVIVTISMAVV